MQRCLDVFFSAFALLVLSPLLIPIALLLKFTGEGEIFYLQDRIGKDGNVFKLYKFATMLKNSPSIGTGTLTIKNDPRILPMGGFLRKTKINELPQLLNILKGDMSVVGPRPVTRRSFEAYSPNIQQTIIKVRPGLSGVGSIIFRNEEELLHGKENPVQFYNEIIAPYKGAVEEWYVNNRNLWIYLTVIFITVWVVIFSNSKLVRRFFSGLPDPPALLKM
jgi:lipopolysaccharide/colanic/teichoic acid biosynthesis glycosyltransferase